MKILTVVGARPQFIKAAVLSRLLRRTAGLREVLVHTGQHYDPLMSDIFFAELDLPRPEYHFQLPAVPAAARLGILLTELEQTMLRERPDAVLVYGDTDSTLAGALVAARLQIPLAHVEAGLRSYDRSMPEEINRVLTDHAARWLFCPTDQAVANLAREGITAGVHQVGDVMCDALEHYRTRPRPVGGLENVMERPFALCTLHRAGNTDDHARFGRLWHALQRLADELPVVLPLHPRSRKVLGATSPGSRENLHVVEPVGYLEMLTLERQASLIVTDSGGVQKEAYLQGVPCLTLRDNTEWVETVSAGWNRLVGADGDLLLAGARAYLQGGPPAERPPLYGDGRAGERIRDCLAAGLPA